jgi:DNA-binding MarR family transcriptional regulator
MSDAADLAREIERLFTALVREGARLGLDESPALTPTQRSALAALVDDGPLRLGALADAIATTDATASRTAQALERIGLVERAPDAADGRGVRLAATPEGKRVVASARRRLRQSVARLIRDGDDRERLAELLRDLTGAVAR